MLIFGHHKPIVASLSTLFLGWNGTESTITEDTTGLLCQPRMIMNDVKCGVISGMHVRGNQSTRRKPALVLFCPLQIPHDLIQAQTQVAKVRIQ
jgi:hypothetical protein